MHPQGKRLTRASNQGATKKLKKDDHRSELGQILNGHLQCDDNRRLTRSLLRAQPPLHPDADSLPEQKEEECEPSSHDQRAQLEALYSKASLFFSAEMDVPVSIKYREKEAEHIRSHLQEAIDKQGHSGILLICGVPGIGKTLTMKSVLNHLEEQQNEYCTAQQVLYRKVGLVQSNAATEAHYLYCRLLGALVAYQQTDPGVDPLPKLLQNNPQKCLLVLDLWFREQKVHSLLQCTNHGHLKRVMLVIIEEIDLLTAHQGGQEVLYNLLDWAQQTHSRLALIGLSNRMDFDDTWSNKIRSRSNLVRVLFRPYDQAMMRDIIRHRMTEYLYFQGNRQDLQLIQPASLDYIAAKLAHYTTDIRKALQICKQALVLARDEFRKGDGKKVVQVDLALVRRSYSQICPNNIQRFVSSLPGRQQILLLEIESDKHGPGVSLPILTNRYNHLASVHLGQVQNLSCCQVALHLHQLITSGFVHKHMEQTAHFLVMVLHPEVPRDDLVAALMDQPYFPRLSPLLE